MSPLVDVDGVDGVEYVNVEICGGCWCDFLRR